MERLITTIIISQRLLDRWFGMSIKNKRKKELPTFEMKKGGLYSSIYLISVRDENYVGGVV